MRQAEDDHVARHTRLRRAGSRPPQHPLLDEAELARDRQTRVRSRDRPGSRRGRRRRVRRRPASETRARLRGQASDGRDSTDPVADLERMRALVACATPSPRADVALVDARTSPSTKSRSQIELARGTSVAASTFSRQARLRLRPRPGASTVEAPRGSQSMASYRAHASSAPSSGSTRRSETMR